ncbi:MAG: TldD/PmbA family protein, partial [Pyramidobacter sp.]|nr:TldD/PmbA family protein [Pyramidobacter sp.]
MDARAASGLLEKTVELAQKRGAKASECSWAHGASASFSVCDDSLERSRTSRFSAAGLRVLDGENRQGVASLTEFDGDTAAELCDAAFANARGNSPEDDVIFAETSPALPDRELGVYDQAMSEWSAAEQIELCLKMSRKARALDPRVCCVRSGAVHSLWGETRTLNSFGASCESRMTSGSLCLTLLARDGEAVEINGASNEARSREALLALSPVREAVSNTVRLLRGKPLRSGRFTLVLEPSVTAAFLSALSDLFCASNVCKGLSLLAGRLGEMAASSALTLIDDGRLFAGSGTSYCDNEMIPTRKTVVLERGRVAAWLCNLQYGRRLGFASTGNGCRGLDSLPDVDVSNFYVMPGKRSGAAIVAACGDCFQVAELMGLHTVDPVTGDFSLGARGIYHHEGETMPVSQVTIAGN